MKEIYPLLSSAMNQELRMSQIANNLANINTPGFKRDDAVFQNVLIDAVNTRQGVSRTAQGVTTSAASENPAAPGWSSLVHAFTDFEHGELRSTGNPLDVAIDGQGFFTVQGDNNEVYYTRAGNFKLNERDELITASGRAVLDANQRPLTLDLTRGKPKVMADGTIFLGNTQAGKLGVVQFPDPQALVKHGEGALFTAPAGLTPQAMATPVLRQEMLESANVSAIDEMVHMIQTERSYQVQQKMMQTVDELTARRLDSARS